ncbi:ATP-grasp fold amidoligase family protein [Marinimicrobium locisalis]|uniref:ATP-grasp fold amidoligase family protein n=1 Tax=Marinimicrobium locisalis TaxID=546022 RepID=UPI0032215EAC
MALFKSPVEKHLKSLEIALADIKAQYRALSRPIKALSKKRSLNDVQAKRLAELKSFKFYPRLGHTEHVFFEAAQPASYRLQRAAQLGAIQHSRKLPPRVVSVKGNSVRFAEEVGLPIPRSEFPLKFDEIGFDEPCVIKPVYAEGKPCIYAIAPQADGSLKDHFSGKPFANRASLHDSVQRAMKKAGISRDAWLKEEMIVGASGSPLDTYDVKMYAFYGEIGLVLQVDRWRGRQYRFFDTNGRMVDTGKYSVEPNISPIFDQQLIDVARKVSLRIPWAHVRIDFLVSDSDWRFGEFTLRPGVPANFNEQWDKKLGELFIKAQARLYEDLILGKEFSEYRQLLDSANKNSGK